MPSERELCTIKAAPSGGGVHTTKTAPSEVVPTPQDGVAAAFPVFKDADGTIKLWGAVMHYHTTGEGLSGLIAALKAHKNSKPPEE